MADTGKHETGFDYRAQIKADIEACVSDMGCQPILFVGSGLSKRYFSGPRWDELLATLAKQCPLIEKDYAYYKQTLKEPLVIGDEFARLYQQWAWGKGKNQFPAEMFSDAVPDQAYIKYTISQRLAALTPNKLSDIAGKMLQDEIAALQRIRPHAVITTNYDQFLELVFPEYQPVIGQSIIHGTQVLFGEIFKIHGCVSDYGSLVFTQRDYDEFIRKKKYLSAKLLTYFSEHPLLFIGYSASDPNIRAILSDIDECIPRPGPAGALIPNIYILEWRTPMPLDYVPPRETLIAIDEGRSVRVKAIETDDFGWVFSAFAAHQPLNAVSPKILRALLHRSYDLVRHDIPRQTVEADFEMLERAINTNAGFAKLFGITTVSKPSSNSADYPYTISLVAEKITGKEGAYWSEAQKYIERIKTEKEVDIKRSDNRYHSATKTGKKATSLAHKYSDHLVELIERMKKGEPYELEL
ncbi:MAG TPA: SIR2 family protein [Stellaceae bacterium]|nr:SIR2 family protein [Stellaceae bacterium]